MWKLKNLPSKVLFRANIAYNENVRMASKKVSMDEKSKAPKKGFFRRAESMTPDNYSKIVPDSTNMDSTSNDSDNRKIMRRSSMICSEGFDKYAFDCHKRDISRSVGLKMDNVTTSQGAVYKQNQPYSEKNVPSHAQSTTPVSMEQTAVRKLSPFKPISVTIPTKNAPVPFKRVPEETIPINISLPSKHVPADSVHFADTQTYNVPPRSPATSIPLSFNPVSQNPNRMANLSVSFADNRPVNATPKFPSPSIPVPESPGRISNISSSSADTHSVNVPPKFPATSIPSSFSPVPDGSHRKSSNSALKVKPMNSVPARNSPVTSKNFSDEHDPVRHAPLSFKHVPEKSRPVTKAFSFRSVSDDSTSNKNISPTSAHLSNEYNPSRNAPLSFKHAPKKTTTDNYFSDKPIPIRSTPLSLKGESVSLRSIPSALKRFDNESSSPIRNIALSLQPVPEEPATTSDSATSTRKNIPDEPIPFRNSPLTLKPMLTKHMSLLKKEKPSFKGHIIKRDSVVHPGRVDMQGSLFIDGKFQNPWPSWKPPTFANILKFGVTRNKSKVPPKQELDLVLPIVKQNFSKLTIPEDGIRVTWIGHSTVLVQMHGLNIITDPIFSDRASPSQVVGPKRYRDPPCSIHDLPAINAVVISHTHYDHLDHNTVTLLNARFGSDLRWFVPLGLQNWMEQVGCENVVELDWWEENCVPEHSDTSFIFTPAQHWSKRAIGDDNKVLWGSWCVLGPKYKFFFAGDTGYCEAFKQIGRVHGPFDLSAIPIGAYEPRWFMKYQHVNPEEAVKIHMDVKSKRSLAIHWGTFSLANEYYLDPPVKLRESLDKCEIPPELFFTMKHGESRLIAQNNLVKKHPLSERNGKES